MLNTKRILSKCMGKNEKWEDNPLSQRAAALYGVTAKEFSEMSEVERKKLINKKVKAIRKTSKTYGTVATWGR